MSTRSWRSSPGGTKSRRECHWRHRGFELTYEEYLAKVEEQGGCCAICGVRIEEKALDADHSHKTGRFRGALCNSCNVKLGWFENNRDAILAYLEQDEMVGRF